MLFHIVTVAQNHIIGKNQKIPWCFPEDREHRSKLTIRSTVIMGRKTYEGLGKPLPDCQNFVLSKSLPSGGDNPQFFDTLGDALGQIKTQKAFILGGADLFMQTLSLIDGVYMTRIHQNYDGDVFYPPLPFSFSEQSRLNLCDQPKIESIYYERIQTKRCPCGE